MLVRLFPVANLDEAKSLVVQINATSRNDCTTAEQSFRLLSHCDNEVAFLQDVVRRYRPTIPFRFVALLFEAAFLKEIAGSKDDVRASTAEVLAEEGEAVLDLKQVAEFAVAPAYHSHASKTFAALPTMRCSSSRASTLSVSSSSVSSSNCSMKSALLTSTPAATPTKRPGFKLQPCASIDLRVATLHSPGTSTYFSFGNFSLSIFSLPRMNSGCLPRYSRTMLAKNSTCSGANSRWARSIWW